MRARTRRQGLAAVRGRGGGGCRRRRCGVAALRRWRWRLQLAQKVEHLALLLDPQRAAERPNEERAEQQAQPDEREARPVLMVVEVVEVLLIPGEGAA